MIATPPAEARLPDFIIIGAMKSGTTSIQHLLDAHPKVFIPASEVYFFDIDDAEQHRDFFLDPDRHPEQHDFERDFELYFRWYARHFTNAGRDQIVGEATTTYLASKRAAERIERVLPDVRLIAMLRDPVNRAHSHYWHNVTRSRATMCFEQTLQRNPGTYLLRGHYEEQLRRYDSFLRRGRLKVVFYEDFVRDKQAVVDDLVAYLGLPGTIDVLAHQTQHNPARAPRFIRPRLAFNRIYQRVSTGSVRRNLPNMPGCDERVPLPKSSARRSPVVEIARSLLHRLPPRPYPPLAADTRRELESHFRRHNAGLAELLGEDVEARWPWMARR